MLFFYYLLFPFAVLYDFITRLRNWLYDKGFMKSTKPTIFTISVGNLTIGGTGKTPHIEYLIQKLVDQYQLVTLSRGYGRKTKGFLLAAPHTQAQDIGDEPMQFYQKFGRKINVTVCEKRVEGASKIEEQFPQTQLILLDDAFQHRAILPHFSILLSDYNRPFYKDFLLPMGRIRESRTGAKRANVILVTKCPKELANQEQQIIRQQIQIYNPKQVFFTYFEYATPIALTLKSKITQKIGVLTALANPKPFVAHVESLFGKIHIQKHFPDHHFYTQNELEALPKENITWFTTEKDAVKLQTLVKDEATIFYIPIEVKFLNNNEEQQFWDLLNQKRISI